MIRRVIPGLASKGRALSGLAVKNLKLGSAAAAGSVSGNECLVKMVAAPINSGDLTSTKSGSEGVGMVAALGDKVTGLREGDWVFPPYGTSSWASEMVIDSSKLTRAPTDIPASYAATMSGDLATAYRLLHDFVKLEAGDCIVQSDAYSTVGMAVIQMAKQMGVKTVNVIDGSAPDADTMMRLLTNLGGDVNVTTDYLGSHEFNSIMGGSSVKLMVLGDNVDGAADMARVGGEGSTMVSIGGASLPADIKAFVTNEMKVKTASFAISDWYKSCKTMDRAQMNANIATMIRTKHLTIFYAEHDFDDFGYALEQAQEPMALRKVVLRMDAPDRMAEHDARTAKDYEHFETDVV